MRTAYKATAVIGFIAIIIFAIAWRNIGKSIEMTDEIANKTLTAEKAIYNYEWFKSQKESIEALKKKELRAQEEADNFKSELPSDRSKWAREDKNEYDRLRAVVTGISNQLSDAVADYNARSQMVTRNIFKDDLPTNIIDGIETGLKYTYPEEE